MPAPGQIINPARDRRVLTLWAAGKTKSEIANAIGGLTYNAVICIVRRARKRSDIRAVRRATKGASQ